MSYPLAASLWLKKRRLNPLARLRLFCFPYAGGGAPIFRQWSHHLPSTVEVCPIQLPGRGDRLLDPPYTRLLTLVEDIARDIQPYLDKPFAFFGHSMGALIGFELARQLRREAKVEPVHLFVSGRRAPQILERNQPRCDLPESELLDELRNLNGTPKELLEHSELMLLMLPLLRADFEVSETYTYTADPPLNCSITAFGGITDLEVTCDHLEAWRDQTAARFTLHMFKGDHFFIHQAEHLLLRAILDELHQRMDAIR